MTAVCLQQVWYSLVYGLPRTGSYYPLSPRQKAEKIRSISQPAQQLPSAKIGKHSNILGQATYGVSFIGLTHPSFS